VASADSSDLLFSYDVSVARVSPIIPSSEGLSQVAAHQPIDARSFVTRNMEPDAANNDSFDKS